ncbi:hypothetical protein EVAR_57613_1 [Eumeta japonica]|uniref:Uncharacterized protein n=1 Tax=Eumeta variegata TaxID=151549 RepID=A0A4C1Y169_EUMVA|nr:hypothetical protein EVAR_57613_1 [Eumeta japonica]
MTVQKVVESVFTAASLPRVRPWRQLLVVPDTCSRVGRVRPLSLFYSDIGRRSGREIARSALSLARSAQAERDNESCFFVRAASVHRFIRHYHVKNRLSTCPKRI